MNKQPSEDFDNFDRTMRELLEVPHQHSSTTVTADATTGNTTTISRSISAFGCWVVLVRESHFGALNSKP